jgi:hypothetical protein
MNERKASATVERRPCGGGGGEGWTVDGGISDAGDYWRGKIKREARGSEIEKAIITMITESSK